MQLALMPAEKPRVPGWDVRLYTRPANDVGGDLETLSRGGVVLDLIEETTYVEQTVDLNAGDFLVAYSDGVSEASARCRDRVCRASSAQ